MRGDTLPKSLFLHMLLVAVMLCSSPTLIAQSRLDWMTSRIWRIQNGLPDQVVQAIVQTPDHYLWLGTKLGLIRFDGYRFLDYGADVAPALHDFGVDCILVARDGTLWVGTEGGGVVHLYPGGARTYNTNSGLANGLIRALYQDEAGRIWAGADHGLYRLASDSMADHFVRMDDTVRTPNAGVHGIVGDGRGGVWVAGSRLLHFRDSVHPGDAPWEEPPLPREAGSVRIWALARGPGNVLWIATLGGLYRLPEDGKGVAIKENRIPGSILSLLVDSHHQLWVGTLRDGLYLLGQDGTLSHVTAPDQLASNAVLALAEDLTHDLWAGTQSGLTRLGDTGMHLSHIPGAIDSEFGSVSVDTDRSLWVCSRSFIHMHDGRIETVRLPALGDATIRTAMRESTGAFWVGTLGEGAYRIAPNGHVDHYSSVIGTNYIRGFLETATDGVWIASDGGVANWRDGRLISFQNVPDSPHALVLAMEAGAKGELWVGTYHGLSLLRNGAFVSTPVAQALGSHMVWALHISDDGALWIGTESGLFRWYQGKLSRLPVEKEMNGQAILAILEDRLHRIWLGGPSTVLRASRASLERMATGENDKLFNPDIFAFSRETGAELSGGAAHSAELDGADGAWFATNEGPLHIQAADPPHGGPPPPIMLGQVSVDGRHIVVSGPIVLAPSAKTLEVEAAPVSLSARPGLQLRRRLIGFDSQWAVVSPLQAATYTNLPPGQYTYRLEANWKGSPEITALELPIVQRAHFYQQPLFRCACVIVLLILAWSVHQLRVRQVAVRFRLIEEERNRMAREMHDTVVQSCIGVSSLLEAIAIRQAATKGQGTHDGQADLLDTAREQMAITILEARDAIWNLRHARGEGNLEHSLRSILHRMTAMQSISIEFQSEGSPVTVDSEVEHEVLMTVREALHNAVVHAAPEHICLSLRYLGKAILISIRDDGRGFAPNASTQDRGEHFGLLGMHERMERVGGSCTIESIPERGTMVVLQVPLGRNTHAVQESR